MSDQTREPPAQGAGPAERPELPKQYRPTDHEGRIREAWERSGAFHADPGRVLRGEAKPYAIVIPPPNVTDRLHLGHALNNTLQDVLARAHRMMGYETLWMPGTDHAGIATQTVVEKRVKAETGRKRTDFSREEFVAKIQAFKDEYEATITGQLKAMGCSCDWARQRFTMDEQCARAVNEAFFRLFRDGLIYRGKRLVNWDPVTQTALADDEVEMEEVDGQFYYLRYPLVHGVAGVAWASRSGLARGEAAHDEGQPLVPITWSELRARGYPVPEGPDYEDEKQAFVTVATTRPETYLGDTAVAVNPRDPRAGALRGVLAELPLVGRVIPILEDDYVVLPTALGGDPQDPKAQFATGFLKVTPAHDTNDYELGQRHDLPVINVLAPDASISDKHGWSDVGDAHIFVGRSREEARKLVAKEFHARGLLEATKPYRHSIGHSYRSHAAIEPYLSDQWYVKATDPAMRDAALRALVDEQRTSPERERGVPGMAQPAQPLAHARGSLPARDGGLRFHPDRYARMYETWLENIRDWCISRQLWWGHRIPVWTANTWNIREATVDAPTPLSGIEREERIQAQIPVWEREGRVVSRNESRARPGSEIRSLEGADPDRFICLRDPSDSEVSRFLEEHRFRRDPDVLDTWFSSALWPMSTMGWPDSTDLLKAFNPTSTLCTAREIITLWVSRMVFFNRYFLPEGWPAASKDGDGRGNGPLPFRDVFIHAMIQDEHGRKMSKTLKNGVDPLDIIETHGADAMRFTLVQMTTHTQDVRMPVVKDAATGRNTSPKFDLGRNFCNKLWNAARFALSILEGAHDAGPATQDPGPGTQHSERAPKDPVRGPQGLSLPDRWMLSRLAAGVQAAEEALRTYSFSDYAQTLYDLLWRDFCDWYLEAIKPTVAGSPAQRAVLAHALETIVRLLHPVAPFITEALWERIREVETGPVAGIELGPSRKAGLLATAGWPQVDPSLRDPEAEAQFERVRSLITAIREVRAQRTVPPKRRVALHAPAPIDEAAALLVRTLAGVETITTEPPRGPSAPFTVDGREMRLSNLADAADAGAEAIRLEKLIADRRREIETYRKRLANPGYAEKAPPAMVQQTRDQLAKAEAEQEAAIAALRALGGGA